MNIFFLQFSVHIPPKVNVKQAKVRVIITFTFSRILNANKKNKTEKIKLLDIWK